MNEYESKAVTTVQETLKAHLLLILHHLIFAGNGVICASPYWEKQLRHIRTINI